jgi:hypothetical protein
MTQESRVKRYGISSAAFTVDFQSVKILELELFSVASKTSNLNHKTDKNVKEHQLLKTVNFIIVFNYRNLSTSTTPENNF